MEGLSKGTMEKNSWRINASKAKKIKGIMKLMMNSVISLVSLNILILSNFSSIKLFIFFLSIYF